jgi:PAS domain S-box-containing protein
MDFKPEWAGTSVPAPDARPELSSAAPRLGDALLSFADAMPVPIAYVGRDKSFRFANKACGGWFDLPPSQICGRSVRDLVGPALYDIMGSYVEAALAGATVRFEVEAPFDRSHRTMRMTFVPDTDGTFVPDTDGGQGVRGFFIHGEDMSERSHLLRQEIADRERVELELVDKERLLSALVETAPSLVVLTDWSGEILLFNRACEELTGFAREEVIGKNLLDLFVPPEWQPTVQRRFADPFAPEVRQPHENPWRTKSGEQRCIEWRCAVLPLGAENGLGVLGIGVDITERKRAEQAAYQQQIELARVLRVNTMGEMAAALAHELNQPLAAILSYTQGCQRLMAERKGALEDVPVYLEKLAGQARRAGEIVRHIRRFIQKDEPLMAECDVNELVREAATFARAEAAMHSVTVTLDLAPGPMPVRAERIAIEQVILNLIHNSVEALVGAKCARRQVTVTTGVREGYVVVGIEDTGPGVSKELLERLFQAFVTTKQNGLGLGLSICRSIVKDHGGEMWLAERDGAGARFFFSIPVAASAPRGDG